MDLYTPGKRAGVLGTLWSRRASQDVMADPFSSPQKSTATSALAHDAQGDQEMDTFAASPPRRLLDVFKASASPASTRHSSASSASSLSNILASGSSLMSTQTESDTILAPPHQITGGIFGTMLSDATAILRAGAGSPRNRARSNSNLSNAGFDDSPVRFRNASRPATPSPAKRRTLSVSMPKPDVPDHTPCESSILNVSVLSLRHSVQLS